MGRPSIGLTFRWKVPSTMCSYVISSCFGGRSLKLWKSQSIVSRTQGKHHHKLLGFAATGLHMGGFCLHSVIIPYQTSVLNTASFETELKCLMLEIAAKYEFVIHIHIP